MLAHHEHEPHDTKGFLSRGLAELSMTIIFPEFLRLSISIFY